jgi:hypothetical protein
MLHVVALTEEEERRALPRSSVFVSRTNSATWCAPLAVVDVTLPGRGGQCGGVLRLPVEQVRADAKSRYIVVGEKSRSVLRRFTSSASVRVASAQATPEACRVPCAPSTPSQRCEDLLPR